MVPDDPVEATVVVVATVIPVVAVPVETPDAPPWS